MCVTSRVIAANGISVLGNIEKSEDGTAMLKIYATRHTGGVCSDWYCIAASDSMILHGELEGSQRKRPWHN